MSIESARIGIVENDAEFRDDFVQRITDLGIINTPVAVWSSGEEFLRAKPVPPPDLLFVDVMLSGMTGIELVKTLRHSGSKTRLVMLTNMNSDELIFEAIKQGTMGYLLKGELGDLEQTIRTVLQGGAIITSTIALRVFASFRAGAEQAPRLTGRERQVLELIVRGKSVKAVAEFLDLSRYTISDHIKQIYKKLEVHNRGELILKAQKLSLM